MNTWWRNGNKMEVGHFHAAPRYSSVQKLVATFTPELHILVKNYPVFDRYWDITRYIPATYREAVIRGDKLWVQGGHPDEGKPPFKIDIHPTRGKVRKWQDGLWTCHQMTQDQALQALRKAPVRTPPPVWYGDLPQHRNPSHPCKSCGSAWTQHHASTAEPGTTAMSHAFVG